MRHGDHDRKKRGGGVRRRFGERPARVAWEARTAGSPAPFEISRGSKKGGNIPAVVGSEDPKPYTTIVG